MDLSDSMLDRIQDVMRRVAKLVAGYEKDLVVEGMDPEKAYELARRLEDRLMGPILDAADPEALDRYDPVAEMRRWLVSPN